MNSQKTELFFTGLNQEESETIASFGFPLGSFPIRYLGLPLMHRKLRIAEYTPLLDKIAGQFNSWTVRSLSYAGRLQLISSVITGTINFWISSCLLPRGCIKKIEALCSRFLWSGNSENAKAPRVAWSSCCFPKAEGGLGLRRLTTWNTTFCLRLIWLLFSESGSLWVAWHRHHHLRDSSFWELELTNSLPWTWKSLLILRPIARKFIFCNMGNGQTTSFWYDNWTNLGPLLELFGQSGPRDLCVPINAKVADVCNHIGWNLREPRSEEALNLHIYLTTLRIPMVSDVKDSFSWVINGKKLPCFSSTQTWQLLRERQSVKDWATSVWFKGSVPAHAFLMWTFQLDRLPTRQRLASWGLNVQVNCCLCNNFPETRDHLFLRCVYSHQIWNWAQARLHSTPQSFHSLPALHTWIMSPAALSPVLLKRIVSQSTIYFLWKQRNNVLHNNQHVPPSIISRDIDRHVKSLIRARRHHKFFKDLMPLWIH